MIIILVLSREIKHRVYIKYYQTAKVRKYHVTKFSIILLVVAVHHNYTKIGKFKQFYP